MIRARSSSVNPLQPPISDRVRQQPRQRLVAPSTTQTLTQGVAMLRGGPDGVCEAIDDMNTKYGPVAEQNLLLFSRPGVSLTMTRNDYDGEIPEKHDVSLFIIHSKGDAR
ncbi:MAG: hypothetical protein RL093_324 [Pseudomonadota bacterium]|jgi:hypothetical protein